MNTSFACAVLVSLSVLLAAPVPASAAGMCTGPICVDNAWARATPPGAQNGALYFTVTNKGGKADSITGAASTAAAKTEIHQSMTMNGMAHMDMAASVVVPANATVSFTPGGYHVMLTGLKTPLQEGASVRVTLNFAGAGALAVDVPVLSVAAQGPAGAKAAAPAMGEMPHTH